MTCYAVHVLIGALLVLVVGMTRGATVPGTSLEPFPWDAGATIQLGTTWLFETALVGDDGGGTLSLRLAGGVGADASHSVQLCSATWRMLGAANVSIDGLSSQWGVVAASSNSSSSLSSGSNGRATLLLAFCGPLGDARTFVLDVYDRRQSLVLAAGPFELLPGATAALNVGGSAARPSPWLWLPVVQTTPGALLPVLNLTLLDLWGNGVGAGGGLSSASQLRIDVCLNATSSPTSGEREEGHALWCVGSGVASSGDAFVVVESMFVPWALQRYLMLSAAEGHQNAAVVASVVARRHDDGLLLHLGGCCPVEIVMDTAAAAGAYGGSQQQQSRPLKLAASGSVMSPLVQNGATVATDCGTAARAYVWLQDDLGVVVSLSNVPFCTLQDANGTTTAPLPIAVAQESDGSHVFARVNISLPLNWTQGWLTCTVSLRTSTATPLRSVWRLTCEAPPDRCPCQTLSPSMSTAGDATQSASIQISEQSRRALADIPLWFQANGNAFPLVILHWDVAGSSPSKALCNASSRWMPASRRWLLIPNPRFLDVPLGLLASFAFGASYCKVGRVALTLSLPLCANASEALWVQRVATFLSAVVDDVTSSAQSAYRAIDATQPDVTSCYGGGSGDLEMWDLTCLERDATRSLAEDQSADGGLVFSQHSAPTVGAMVVVVVGVLVSLVGGVGAVWFAWYTMHQQLHNKVKLTNRKRLLIGMKWRIALAHLLAPFTAIAHAYTIYNLRGMPVGEALFSLDIAFAVLFYVATVVRLGFPRHRWTTPIYVGGILALLFYTSFLLGQASLWAVAALSIDVRLIPYATAGCLILLQVPWQIKLCGEQLMPSVSMVTKHFRQEGFVQSTVPVNNALSLALFTVVMLLFMFAVTQVQDITPFMAVISSFVMVAYSFLANYSISRNISAAMSSMLGEAEAGGGDRGGFGNDSIDVATANDSAGDGASSGRRSPQEMLVRLLRGTQYAPLTEELTRFTSRISKGNMGEDASSAQQRSEDQLGNERRRTSIKPPKRNLKQLRFSSSSDEEGQRSRSPVHDVLPSQ